MIHPPAASIPSQIDCGAACVARTVPLDPGDAEGGLMKEIRRIVIAVCLLALGAAQSAQATDISGTIATTLTIYDNSRLVGDVTCTVTGAPCIAFGAPGLTLKLNGF